MAAWVAVQDVELVLLSSKDLQNAQAEVRQIARSAAGNKVTVNNHGRVFENRAGVDEVVFDAGRTRHANAVVAASMLRKLARTGQQMA